MAPKDKKQDDFEFIMTCLQYTENLQKPDFAKVAAATGAKDATSCYHKHWRIMASYGMTSKRGKTNAKAATTTSDDTPQTSGSICQGKRKRGPPKKERVPTGDTTEDESDHETNQAKKVKHEDRDRDGVGNGSGVTADEED